MSIFMLSIKVFYGFAAIFLSFMSVVRSIPLTVGKCSRRHMSNEQGQLINQIEYRERGKMSNLPRQCTLSSSLYVDASPALQKRLDSLEEKVTLLAKTHELNASKESLMNISLQRIKSLEAEVVETRKVSC